MPTKYETFAELAARTEKPLTDSAESWKSFLVAAARLYKYPYHEQLLIFAQRPDATACAAIRSSADDAESEYTPGKSSTSISRPSAENLPVFFSTVTPA